LIDSANLQKLSRNQNEMKNSIHSNSAT